MKRGRSAGRAVSRQRKPRDWVHTVECYDLSATGLLLTLDGVLDEVVLPVMDAWGVFQDTVGIGFTQSLPWPRRTCLRVKGWLHMFSPDYFDGTVEYSIVSQLEKFQVDSDSGVCIMDVNPLLDANYADTHPVYWKNFQHLYHNSGWTTPDDFDTFKRSIFINASMKVRLDERETIGLHLQHTNWNGASPTTRTFIRPMLRTLVETG